MKQKLFLLVLLMTLVPCTFKAQDRNNDDEVVKIDRYNMHASVPNQLLVKFHDYSDIRVDATKGGKRFTSPSKAVLQINSVLEEYDVAGIEQLIPNFVMPKSPRSSKSYGGQDVVEHDLSQLHLIVLSDSSAKNHFELIEALKELDEVEYAEPNYICFALGSPAEETMVADATAVDRNRLQAHSPKSIDTTGFSTNDPMYALQWGFTATRLDSLLMQPKLDSAAAKKIIAIIDTGVDVDHPDLAANIWTNTAEQNGANNQDDDNNGFTDDIHGWDFVNQTGNMHDFNSHGTHCAGIAAAVGHNGIGIIGANPDALIMPVTVLQSDGVGSIATLVQGISYAARNGADVISMSLGTYAYSIALEQALAQAYQTALLTAAAGNDAKRIDPRCGIITDAPMYPGAFYFVIGVQATQQIPDPDGNVSLASFSNFDCDGPSYSQYGEEQLYNYEISAPGVGLMSTVPNGRYRSCSGTSMACPLVAGGLSSLLERKAYANKEVLFGDLINRNGVFQHINYMDMYNSDSISPAKLQLVTYEVNDTLYGDSSWYADAGERIQIYPTIRTLWGQADSITTWIEFQEYEDTSVLHFVDQIVDFGRPLSSYGKNKSLNPIDIIIDSNVVDGRRISLTLCASSPQAIYPLRQDFALSVTNGVKLGGMIEDNDTLWPNVHYLVTQNLAVAPNKTLVIKPGVTLKISDNVSINSSAGKLLALGTLDSMITFTRADNGNRWGTLYSNSCDTLNYCILEYGKQIVANNVIGNSTYRNGHKVTPWSAPQIINSIIRYFWPTHGTLDGNVLGLSKSNIYYNVHSSPPSTTAIFHSEMHSYYGQMVYSDLSQDNNICCNQFLAPLAFGSETCKYIVLSNNIFGNININGYDQCQLSAMGTMEVYVSPVHGALYIGSAKESIRNKLIYDMNYPGANTFGRISFDSITTRPVPGAHGVVWKVEVNGYDSQDEFDSIAPLGPGVHEFRVYFNRAMDTNVTPKLAMGVRPPYTQTSICDDSYWSEDGTTWTAHLILTGRESIDGLNRIYVANAQDNEHFEIPYENLRFNVQVSSSGSMSAGFQATPGIGKVDLEWNDQEVNYEDFLGFNLYRYYYDSVLTNRHYVSGTGYVYDTVWMPVDTILLNSTLLQDTVFTDYNVVPGERYYYYYKILSTSLTENSPSKTVSCVPQSSIRGDANGSYVVDIADVITAINYMTNQNPQPFLFDATDVNGDGVIDVLDVVGIINIILYGDQGKQGYEQQTAIYTVEDGILYVDSPVALAGLQFTLADCTMADIEVLDALNGFELINAPVGEDGLMLMAYSMSGKQVPSGKTALLRIGDMELDNIVLSDPEGHNVVALKGGEEGITDVETIPAQIMKVFPNPFEKEVQIVFNVGDATSSNAQLIFTDLMGRRVYEKNVALTKAGQYSYTWNADGMDKGVYFVTLYINGIKAHTTKVVLK